MVFLFLASIIIVVVDVVDDCYYVPKFYFNMVSWIELCGNRYTSRDVVVATSSIRNYSRNNCWQLVLLFCFGTAAYNLLFYSFSFL